MTGTLRPRGGPMNSRPAVGTPRKALTSPHLARPRPVGVECAAIDVPPYRKSM